MSGLSLIHISWYRAARQRPGEVCVGVAEPGTLLSGKNRRGDLLLTAALQVEPGYGGSALEVACLYFETDAEEMLESYNSEAGAVRMALALDGAFLAGDEALAPAVERFLGPEGVPGGGMAVSYTHLDVYKRQVLDGRLVHNGEHLLGHGLCGGQHAGAQACRGDDGFTDLLHGKHSPLIVSFLQPYRAGKT